MIPDHDFLSKLISIPSITPHDKGCMQIISDYLKIEPQYLNRKDTTNAYFEMGEGPFLLFVGHTDVVPPGPLDLWDHDPFTLTEKDGSFWGRGMVDMKGSIFAFCSAFKAVQDQLQGKVGILLTSDEEGSGYDGLMYAIPKLNLKADWALVGEPTSLETFGDTYKHERRGSHHFTLRLEGTQGHIAYPHLSKNPSDILTRFLSGLNDLKSSFPKDNDLSIYSIETSTHTGNIIPKFIQIKLNLRYRDSHTIQMCLDYFKTFDPKTEDTVGAKPYQSNPKIIQKALTQAIRNVTGVEAKPSNLGGTSDARFLPGSAKEIIEFGLRSEKAHQINESAPIQDILNLQKIYQHLLLDLLSHDKTQKKSYPIEKEALL